MEKTIEIPLDAKMKIEEFSENESIPQWKILEFISRNLFTDYEPKHPEITKRVIIKLSSSDYTQLIQTTRMENISKKKWLEKRVVDLINNYEDLL